MSQILAAALATLISCSSAFAGGQSTAPRGASGHAQNQFNNPVISGFAPDPSIVRVGRDFYLVTSSFEYFPAIPVYHSTDLVNWTLIGHALSDPGVAGLHEVESSGGVQAATIRHHDGVFYVVTTSIVDGKPVSFIVTATDPKGPWSAPHVIADAVGIDPSILFDDDGRVWYVANWLPPDPKFPGQTEIWVQQLDLASWALVGPRHFVWRGCCQGVWAEAPHIYKKDGTYILMIAEGGTSYEHAVAVAVAGDIAGPYRNDPRNPVLTHRHLSYDHPITSVGHADLVELPDGRWYAVVLGTRRLDGQHATLGRETFLLPVRWETEREWWKQERQTYPVFSPDSGKVELQYAMPMAGTHQTPVTHFRDDFHASELGPEWTFRRAPMKRFHSLADKPGTLRLWLQPGAFAERAQYSFVGIRQRQFNVTASVHLQFKPDGQEEAGLVVIQKDTAAFALTMAALDGGRGVLRLSHYQEGGRKVLAEQPWTVSSCFLRVIGDGLAYRFESSVDGRRWTKIGPVVDGRELSPAVLKGFNYTGVFMGLYATSNGAPTHNHADFESFRYESR